MTSIVHLKTKPEHGGTQRFAILIEPDFTPTPKRSDEDNNAELYQTARDHGVVRIAEFLEDNPFSFKDRYTEMTPEKFEEEWMGD